MINIFKFNQIPLVVLFYLKLLFQILLEYDALLLDIFLYVLLLISFDIRKVNRDLIFIVVLAILSLFNAATRNLFLILFSVYLLKGWSLQRFAIINLICCMGLLGGVVFLQAFGVLKAKMFDLYLLDDRERWDFGFGNPNTFSLFIYSVILNIYIAFVDKWKYGLPLLLLIFSLGIFSYTGSRTFMLSVIILVGFHYYFLNRKKFKAIKVVCMFLPVVFMGLLVYLSLNAIDFGMLNLALSGRLELYHKFLADLSWLDFLIGNSQVNNLDTIIDSFYLQLLFQGGILGVGYIMYLNYATVRNIGYESRFLFPVLLSFWAYGIGESIGVFILIFGNMIFWMILLKKGIVSASICKDIKEV